MSTSPKPQMKPHVAGIAAYVPGKAGLGGKPVIAKLGSNENPFGPSPAAIAAMTEVIAHGGRYPDPAATALREKLGATFGIEPERIVCGTGSDELLHVVAGAFAGPGDEVLFSRHSFAVYEIAARQVGATPVIVPDRDYAADVDAMLAAVTPRTRLVYLANPNNPTGTLISASDVRRLHAGLPSDVVFAIDAAYAEFAEGDYEDGIALVRQFDNVVMLRTFSKIYGLAAQRVGWAYAAPHIIDAMNRLRGPFNVTTTGQAGAVAALDDKDWVEKTRVHTAKWRQWLSDEVTAMSNKGLRPIPSFANFVMIEFPESGPVSASGANDALLHEGVIARYLAVQGMPRCLRISIGTEDETRAAAAALRRYVEAA